MRIADDLRACRGTLLVVTGAGISLASGIPTFRGTDPGAVWSVDLTELGTRRYFERDPVGSWRWYLGRFGGLEGKAPNAAHHALVEIERRRDDFLLVTQNIDGLHRAAGSTKLVEVHGSAHHVRCARCHRVMRRAEVDFGPFLADPRRETLPRCPACGALVRPHVLWFDEYYTDHADYRYEDVARAARDAGMMLFVGTSFSVGVTAMLLGARVPTWSIDPSGERPAPHVQVLAEKAEIALPALVAHL